MVWGVGCRVQGRHTWRVRASRKPRRRRVPPDEGASSGATASRRGSDCTQDLGFRVQGLGCGVQS